MKPKLSAFVTKVAHNRLKLNSSSYRTNTIPTTSVKNLSNSQFD